MRNSCQAAGREAETRAENHPSRVVWSLDWDSGSLSGQGNFVATSYRWESSWSFRLSFGTRLQASWWCGGSLVIKQVCGGSGGLYRWGRFGVLLEEGLELWVLCFGVICCGGGVEDLDRTCSAVAALDGSGRGYDSRRLISASNRCLWAWGSVHCEDVFQLGAKGKGEEGESCWGFACGG